MKINFMQIIIQILISLQFLYMVKSILINNEESNKKEIDNSIPKTKAPSKKNFLSLYKSYNNINEKNPFYGDENENEKNAFDLLNEINLDSEANYKIENSTRAFYLENKIMAHRGLFGYFPEHSIKGFELAYYMGADYLETDINLTKDGKMVVFHDPVLDVVTNIADFPQYESRKRNKTIDGIRYKNSYFISDFTYEELSQLYLTQRFKNRPQIYNKEFKILLIEDLIKLVIALNTVHNKNTGIYIEPKNPLFFKEELQLSISEELLNLLNKYNLTSVSDAEKNVISKNAQL